MKQVKRIKVLHVVGTMNRAGTETMLMTIFRSIDRGKIQFDFISYSEEEAHYDEEIRQLGGRVIRLSRTNSVRQHIDVIKKYGPYDAVHSHTLFHCGIANLAARLSGVKIRIAHAHTTLDKSDRLLRKLYIHSMRPVINTFSTHRLSCSKEAGRYLFGEKLENWRHYMYFPNLIDCSPFLADQEDGVKAFKEEEQLENNLVIGHIGRFMDAKNHHFLLEVLQSLLKKDAPVKLLLVGDGELREEIEKEAEKKKLTRHICFAGIREDIPAMLQSMDIFVFPSIYEGLGLVLLEAQATGLPCVVSEAIQPEADLDIGLVTQIPLANGPDAWAERILKMAAQKETDKEKIMNAFKEKEYALNTGLSKLEKIYNLS
ncbi:glycosyltransferase family 1 protein [Salipaludibacillus aurantiacus]|uniref:Glycosyltransferase EpsF n=1 Tax=Salipaludibacillus aurantiacus TaxID=1601833 RepID=A0A1H9TPA3_9BACI|nr:glycosyltransferase family 1 protein [Salipaludibacillus aurantiacus]SER98945.1 glycosyltransferase EpsF [Salipaludibacillus aurantiacus]